MIEAKKIKMKENALERTQIYLQIIFTSKNQVHLNVKSFMMYKCSTLPLVLLFHFM